MMTLTSSTRRALQQVLLVLVALSATLTLVLAVPAAATEGEEAPTSTEAPAEGAEEEGGKLTISDNPHDQFGLVLFGLGGLAALAMLANAANQLRGKRPAADGRIRWR